MAGADARSRDRDCLVYGGHKTQSGRFLMGYFFPSNMFSIIVKSLQELSPAPALAGKLPTG